MPEHVSLPFFADLDILAYAFDPGYLPDKSQKKSAGFVCFGGFFAAEMLAEN